MGSKARIVDAQTEKTAFFRQASGSDGALINDSAVADRLSVYLSSGSDFLDVRNNKDAGAGTAYLHGGSGRDTVNENAAADNVFATFSLKSFELFD